MRLRGIGGVRLRGRRCECGVLPIIVIESILKVVFFPIHWVFSFLI